MAPTKFEESIKEKLEKRRLDPKPGSWDRLSERLDKEQKTNTSKGLWWLGIAAGVIILIALTLFESDFGTNTRSPNLVDSKNPSVDDSINKGDAVVKQNVMDKAKELNKNELVVDSREILHDKEHSKIKKDIPIIKEKNPGSKGLVEPSGSLSKNSNIAENMKSIDKEKLNGYYKTDLNGSEIERTMSDVKKLQLSQASVSDSEIDSLLKWAQSELFKDKIHSEKTYSVDAEKLLMEVETDIEKSFRGRIFETLKNSYITIKTSVAERNN